MDEVKVFKESGVTISMIKYIKKSRCQIMTKESKSVNDVSPEQINQWIKEHQDNANTEAQDRLVNHYRKLIESLAYKYSKDNHIMKI